MKNKKLIIIVALIVFLLIIASIITYFICKTDKLDTDNLGDFYYYHLMKDIEDGKIYNNVENNSLDVSFIKLEDDNAMKVEYKEEGKKYINIYRKISQDNEEGIVFRT